MIWNREDMFLAVAVYINRIMVFAVLDDEYIHTPDRGENLGLELAVGKPGAFCRNLELRAFIGVNVFVRIKVIRIQNVGLQVDPRACSSASRTATRCALCRSA